MIYARSALLAAVGLLSLQTTALQLPACCSSRVSASRVVAQPAVSRAAICLCDAAEAAPVEAAAEAPAEAAEGAEVAAAAKPRPSKAGKTPLEELVVGADFEGKVRSVMTYGAFIDIGASSDGLLHVSEISNEFVKDANEKLSVGDVVSGKIKAVDLEKKQLALTSKEPRERRERKPRADLSEFEGADPKVFVTGKVNSITDFGAFVTIKEGVDGLVHISQIQQGGVGKVEDVLSIGQEVQVRITQVDKGKRRIGLSMKEWSENEAEENKKGGRRGGGGGFGGTGFGEADKEFHLSADELEALSEGDEFDSPFGMAMDRAAYVKEVKGAKGRYAAQVL